jgi:hypothetical protein
VSCDKGYSGGDVLILYLKMACFLFKFHSLTLWMALAEMKQIFPQLAVLQFNHSVLHNANLQTW